MMNRTRPCVGARVSDAADEAFQASMHALDSGRQFAADAADRIVGSSRDLRHGAAELARMSAESVSDATVAAQRRLGRYARATRRYVASEPLKSTLIAVAVGAAAAGLVLALYRSRRASE